MKIQRIYAIISILFVSLLIMFLVSCSNGTENSTSQETNSYHTVSAVTTITFPHFGPMPPNADYTKDYKIETHNGVCYFVFDDPSAYKAVGSDRASISFDSVADFRERVLNGKLTGGEKSIIAAAFEEDEHGFRICDVNNMYTPTLPTGCEMYGGVEIVGDVYFFFFSLENAEYASIACYPQDEYDKLYNREYDEYANNPKAIISDIEQSDTAEKTAIYYRYYPDSPWDIYLFCSGKEVCYVVQIYGLTEIPDESWLTQIGLERYEESE